MAAKKTAAMPGMTDLFVMTIFILTAPPVISASGSLVKKTGITPATANKALGHLEQLYV